ncbi:hypothetical protein DOTSEDRAFT_39615 [Dothistroma septosporum NZE10]|uniref:Uncharacterized protein n=1 Tax=Dothistroma septosporum (strain NZE10 / CBS 128990) TaxID=675120 RepID=M2XZF3_DOTSN|nr:hypothetical protein DOTSEDRAFT_39615 [Dothistroma septosporum NZE10]
MDRVVQSMHILGELPLSSSALLVAGAVQVPACFPERNMAIPSQCTDLTYHSTRIEWNDPRQATVYGAPSHLLSRRAPNSAHYSHSRHHYRPLHTVIASTAAMTALFALWLGIAAAQIYTNTTRAHFGNSTGMAITSASIASSIGSTSIFYSTSTRTNSSGTFPIIIPIPVCVAPSCAPVVDLPLGGPTPQEPDEPDISSVGPSTETSSSTPSPESSTSTSTSSTSSLISYQFLEQFHKATTIKIPHGSNRNIARGSTSNYLQFKDRPLAMGLSGLYGCTSLIVTSRRGVWMSHIWQSELLKFRGKSLGVVRVDGKDQLERYEYTGLQDPDWAIMRTAIFNEMLEDSDHSLQFLKQKGRLFHVPPPGVNSNRLEDQVQAMIVTSRDNWFSDGVGGGLCEALLNDLMQAAQSSVDFFKLDTLPAVFKYATFFNILEIAGRDAYEPDENGDPIQGELKPWVSELWDKWMADPYGRILVQISLLPADISSTCLTSQSVETGAQRLACVFISSIKTGRLIPRGSSRTSGPRAAINTRSRHLVSRTHHVEQGLLHAGTHQAPLARGGDAVPPFRRLRRSLTIEQYAKYLVGSARCVYDADERHLSEYRDRRSSSNDVRLIHATFQSWKTIDTMTYPASTFCDCDDKGTAEMITDTGQQWRETQMWVSSTAGNGIQYRGQVTTAPVTSNIGLDRSVTYSCALPSTTVAVLTAAIDEPPDLGDRPLCHIHLTEFTNWLGLPAPASGYDTVGSNGWGSIDAVVTYWNARREETLFTWPEGYLDFPITGRLWVSEKARFHASAFGLNFNYDQRGPSIGEDNFRYDNNEWRDWLIKIYDSEEDLEFYSNRGYLPHLRRFHAANSSSSNLPFTAP